MNHNPSINPADEGSLPGTLQFSLRKVLENVNDMLPAKVIAYDRAANRVTVQPLIMILNTDNTTTSRAQIASIPVLVLGGGNAMISFNLNPGDLGWIMANDRDISLFLQSYQESKPNTLRLHSFSDGLFIPDVMRGYTINSEDNANLVIQSTDGARRISIWNDRIKITAPLIELSGDVLVDGDMTVSGNTVLEGDATVEGELSIEGGMTATGAGSTTVTFTGDFRLEGSMTASGNITPHVP